MSGRIPHLTACDGLLLFSAVWHSLTQIHGSGQGVYFDPKTLDPLVRTAAFKAASELFMQLWPRALHPPNGACGFSHPGLRSGMCAISIGSFEQVKVKGLGRKQPLTKL